ncbi:hypothetical protein [Megamonas funiformis]|uniref:hypothetical protein n=1 Tax=Megamonas funiformis TaxID=437897 RepID=UPI003995C71D
MKYFDGTKWVLVNNKATEDISVLKQDVETLKESKVDKVNGKQLSTEDFTTAEKSKLAGLSNYNDDEVRELISALALRVGSLEERVAALETPAA